MICLLIQTDMQRNKQFPLFVAQRRRWYIFSFMLLHRYYLNTVITYEVFSHSLTVTELLLSILKQKLNTILLINLCTHMSTKKNHFLSLY